MLGGREEEEEEEEGGGGGGGEQGKEGERYIATRTFGWLGHRSFIYGWGDYNIHVGHGPVPIVSSYSLTPGPLSGKAEDPSQSSPRHRRPNCSTILTLDRMKVIGSLWVM